MDNFTELKPVPSLHCQAQDRHNWICCKAAQALNICFLYSDLSELTWFGFTLDQSETRCLSALWWFKLCLCNDRYFNLKLQGFRAAAEGPGCRAQWAELEGALQHAQIHHYYPCPISILYNWVFNCTTPTILYNIIQYVINIILKIVQNFLYVFKSFDKIVQICTSLYNIKQCVQYCKILCERL